MVLQPNEHRGKKGETEKLAGCIYADSTGSFVRRKPAGNDTVIRRISRRFEGAGCESQPKQARKAFDQALQHRDERPAEEAYRVHYPGPEPIDQHSTRNL